jgi:hypothetical protein
MTADENSDRLIGAAHPGVGRSLARSGDLYVWRMAC